MLDHVAFIENRNAVFIWSVEMCFIFVAQINVIFMRSLYEALCDCIINRTIWLLLRDICISNRDIYFKQRYLHFKYRYLFLCLNTNIAIRKRETDISI